MKRYEAISLQLGGQYDVQSGRSGMEKDQEEDQGEDGVMTSNSGKGQRGTGQQRTRKYVEDIFGFMSNSSHHDCQHHELSVSFDIMLAYF